MDDVAREQSRAPARRRWRRGLGAALAVALAAMVAPVATAAPAGAISQTTIHPEWVDGCPGCPGPVFHVQNDLDRRAVDAVTRSLANGLGGLIVAASTKDPAAADRLHDAAIRSLLLAASQSGNSGWSVADWDGELCPRWKWPFPPGPKPRWDEMERWVADGMTTFGRANLTGDQGLLRSGTEQLGAGAAALSEFQGCV